MTSPLLSIIPPSLDAATAGGLTGTASKSALHARMREQAESFEATFVNSMFQQMYTGIQGEGPFGNSTGVGPWRSFLTDEYAKIFVRSGGVGIADAVYKSMLAHQEAQATQALPQGPRS